MSPNNQARTCGDLGEVWDSFDDSKIRLSALTQRRKNDGLDRVWFDRDATYISQVAISPFCFE
jgi:hypothetical protein